MTITSPICFSVGWITCNMADFRRNPTRIWIALCAALIVFSFVGHFLVDIAGGEPPALGLHFGFTLLVGIAIGGLPALVFTLIGSNLHSWSPFLPLPIRPPIRLH